MNVDKCHKALLSLAEEFRTKTPPDLKSCMQCLLAILNLPVSPHIIAKTNYHLGSLIHRYTYDTNIAQTYLERAYEQTQTPELQVVALVDIYLSQNQRQPAKQLLTRAINDTTTSGGGHHNLYWHYRFLLKLSHLNLEDGDFANANNLLSIGAQTAGATNDSFTRILFLLSKGMVLMIARKYPNSIVQQPQHMQQVSPEQQLVETLATSGNLLEAWQGDSSRKEALKVFFLVLQVCHHLNKGHNKSAKPCLKLLQQSIQNLTNVSGPDALAIEETNFISPNMSENFMWMPKEHMCVLVYLISVLHSMQAGFLDKAQKYTIAPRSIDYNHGSQTNSIGHLTPHIRKSVVKGHVAPKSAKTQKPQYAPLLSCSLLLILLSLCCFCHASQRSKIDLCYKNLTTSTNSQRALYQKYSTQKHCLDIRLPYRTSIIPDYTPELQSIEQISSYIEKWEQFRSLPKCWHYLQVTLCSLFMPQLDEDPASMRATRVSQPSVDNCNNMFKNCRFISRHYTWPAEYFNCSDTSIYAKNCSNEFRDFRHKSHTCQYPLVPSNDSSSWFRDVGGCSVHCKYPVLDTGDQEYIKILIQILSTSGFLITLAATMIQTKSSLLSQVIGWCMGSQLPFYLGWSLQTILGRDIACSSSGASLYDLPFVANACILSFALTYLSMLCFSIWYAYMGQVFHQELVEKGSNKVNVNGEKESNEANVNSKKESTEANVNNGTRRIKVVKWLSILLPSALFIAVLFIGQIDGNGLYGICTVGQKSIILKYLFVFAPDFICTIYGTIYLIRTISNLSTVIDKNPISKKIYKHLVIIVILNSTRLLLSIGNHFYAHRNQISWEESIDKLVACKLDPHLDEHAHDMDDILINRQDCELNIKNLVPLYYVELISTLGLGLILAWWTLSDINTKTLKRMIINLLEDENRQPGHNEVQMDTLRYREYDDVSNCSKSVSLGGYLLDGTRSLLQRTWRSSMRRDRPVEVTVDQEQQLRGAYDFHKISAQIQDRLRQPLVYPQPQFYFYGNRTENNDG